MAETTDSGERTASTVDANSIGPQLNLEDIAFPEDVGRAIAHAHGVKSPVRTGAEWVATTKAALGNEVGTAPTVDDLCTSADGRHTFSARDSDHSQSYVCVLDPLIYPFLTDTPGTVRSVTPVHEETVEITVGEESAAASHDEAVVSLGAATGLDPDAEVSFERVYADVCGYVHVFADEAKYDAWREKTDGATTAVPVDEGVAISRELATALFG
jgi:hypothetical protein